MCQSDGTTLVYLFCPVICMSIIAGLAVFMRSGSLDMVGVLQSRTLFNRVLDSYKLAEKKQKQS